MQSTAATTATTGTVIVPNRLSPPAPAAENSAATTWVLKAIAAEKQMGSVHLDGTIKQGKSDIALHLVLDGDGDGTGQFTQAGNPDQAEPHRPVALLQRPEEVLGQPCQQG